MPFTRCFLVFSLLATLLVTAGPIAAQPRAGDCFVGPGLASTLLFPYVEVDLDDPNGKTTLLSIGAGLSPPVLVRAVLWTDWGVPTLAFDIFLEGFSLQTINVRSLFDGVVPSTGASADLSSFPFCGSLPPFHANPVLNADGRAQLAAFHTGVAGPFDTRCAGAHHGDNVARGYMTVDVVDECSGVESPSPLFTPANTSYPYFADGGSGGIATDTNALWGDYYYVDFAGNAAQGSEAVAIWSDPGMFAGTNIYTFYGRYSGWDGRDNRVPLPYRWDQRFFNGGPFAGGADLVVWRDTGSAAHVPVPCSGAPAWSPLSASTTAIPESGQSFVNLAFNAFGMASQRVDLSTLSIPFAFGWVQVDTFPGQSWIQPTLTAGGRFSATANGTPVEFLCNSTPPP